MTIALENLELGSLAAAVADIRTILFTRLIDAGERFGMCAEKRGSPLKRDATRIGL